MPPCIKNRQGCSCGGGCVGSPFFITFVLKYGCTGSLSNGTITNVTIGGTTITVNFDGTYTNNAASGTAIVVNWTAGSLGSVTSHFTTTCSNQTLSATIGPSLFTHPPLECCGGAFTEYPDVPSFELTATSSLFSGGMQFISTCFFGDDILPFSGPGFYAVSFTVTGTGTFTIFVQDFGGRTASGPGTGTNIPINVTFLASAMTGDAGLIAALGDITVTP